MIYDFTLELHAGNICIAEVECSAHYKSDRSGYALDYVLVLDMYTYEQPVKVTRHDLDPILRGIAEQAERHLDTCTTVLDEIHAGDIGGWDAPADRWADVRMSNAERL